MTIGPAAMPASSQCQSPYRIGPEIGRMRLIANGLSAAGEGIGAGAGVVAGVVTVSSIGSAAARIAGSGRGGGSAAIIAAPSPIRTAKAAAIRAHPLS